MDSSNKRKSLGFCYTEDVSAEVLESDEESISAPPYSPLSATSIDDVHSYTSEMHSDDLVDMEDAEREIETGNELVSTIDLCKVHLYTFMNISIYEEFTVAFCVGWIQVCWRQY